MHRDASREVGDLMPARSAVGDDQLLGLGLAHGRQQVGFRHGARHVLRLGLIAEGARHAAAGRGDRRNRQIRRLAQRRERGVESAEALLMAMAVHMRLRRHRPKRERNLFARHPLAEGDRAARERSRFAARQQGQEFVAQGQQAGGLEADDRRVARERRQRPPGFGARLLDQAGRKIGAAAAERTAVVARQHRPSPAAARTRSAARRFSGSK